MWPINSHTGTKITLSKEEVSNLQKSVPNDYRPLTRFNGNTEQTRHKSQLCDRLLLQYYID